MEQLTIHLWISSQFKQLEELMDADYCNVAIAVEVAYKIGNGVHYNESEYGCWCCAM